MARNPDFEYEIVEYGGKQPYMIAALPQILIGGALLLGSLLTLHAISKSTTLSRNAKIGLGLGVTGVALAAGYTVYDGFRKFMEYELGVKLLPSTRIKSAAPA